MGKVPRGQGGQLDIKCPECQRNMYFTNNAELRIGTVYCAKKGCPYPAVTIRYDLNSIKLWIGGESKTNFVHKNRRMDHTWTFKYQKRRNTMLFKVEHVELILKGKKTQTRRLWKKPMAKVKGIYKVKTQMLSKGYFALIEVTKIRQEKLLDISEKDAKAEGFPSKKKFLQKFEEINHGKAPEWGYNPMVTVIEFRVIEQ
jgi:hypothetical protein